MTAILRLLVLAALCLAPATVRAQALPALTAPVNDFARVIDSDSAALLDTRIRALQSATGDVIVVATVPTFAPYGSIEEYANRLFAQAGIGKRGEDRGALVVLAVEERRVRIEVGYGLEGVIPDGVAGDIVRRQMLPAFRTGAFGAGLVAGVEELARRMASDRGVEVDGLPAARPAAPESSGLSFWHILLIIAVLIALSNLGSGGSSGHMRGRRGGGWHGGVGGFGGGFGGFGGGFGGGRGGGGFGGFGGGRSGGGGASGGW